MQDFDLGFDYFIPYNCLINKFTAPEPAGILLGKSLRTHGELG